MKNSRETRAMKFLSEIFPYIDDMYDIDSIYDGVEEYKKNHPWRKISLRAGAVRAAIITSDYVIKWDYDETAALDFGGCEKEFDMWNIIKESKFSYLFAETIQIYFCGMTFNIMPRINHIGRMAHKGADIFDLLTVEEKIWLRWHITDLHHGNWGMYKGRPVIIDYAYEKE